MNGAQDMGGKHGFGPVKPELNEPVFHDEWEKRAFALTLAMGMPGGWNIDMSRFARENRPPAEYLSMSYYQIWFAALEHMAKERGLVSDDEIEAGHSLRTAKPVKRVLSPADVAKTLHRGGPTERDTNTKAEFKPGDRVRAKNINPPTHTRLPAYVRGHVGTIERVLGCHVFPDSNATGAGENPQCFTPCVSMDASFGVRTAIRRPKSRSTHGSLIWSAPEMPFDPRAGMRAAIAVPGVPRDADGPVFREPWEVQAFAMTLALHERGVFTWKEWAAALADEIQRAQAAGDPDTG